MTRLNNHNLGNLNDDVAIPCYERAKLTPGIVHVGVGGFHRAHQAMYLDELMQQGLALDWGIVCACGLRRVDKRMQKRSPCRITFIPWWLSIQMASNAPPGYRQHG